MPANSKIAYLSGQKFGDLLVLDREVSARKHRPWICRCVCGATALVTTGNLRNGSVVSCGCRKRASRHMVRHGESGPGRRSKEYRTWAHIIGRCHNPTDAAYPDYGARGIEVCPRWRGDFSAFLADMGRAPSAKHSIERINNARGYSPDNCRWATPAEQARNTRRNVLIDGVPLVDVCASRGLSYGAIQARLRRGHPPELALSPLTGHAYRAMISSAPSPLVGEES